MSGKAAITVNRSREDVQRLWQTSEYRTANIARTDATVTFRDAPGDRGTEIHVDLGSDASGNVGRAVRKLARAVPLAKVKDDLRHFKQVVETGDITRSDGAPEGERAERKLKQRPAQPLGESELGKAATR